MAVVIRLARMGAKHDPKYRVTVADSRRYVTGKFLDILGTYIPSPKGNDKKVELDLAKVEEWIKKGAQPTDTVRRILSFKGVLYLKHLLRGVKLGLFDDATAMTKFEAWYAQHETSIASKNDAHKKAQADKKVYVPVVKKVAEPVAEAPAEVVAEEAAPEVEAPVAEAEAPAAEAAAEETPAAE